MTAVVDDNNKLCGLFTDGDLRRSIDKTVDIHNTRIDEVMTPNCRTISADILAAEALAIMEDGKINGLIVVDKSQQVVGALNMHDLLKAGVI